MRILEPTADPTAGCPASKRVRQDCTKWTVNLLIINDFHGCTVLGLGDPNGKQKNGLTLVNKQGGVRL